MTHKDDDASAAPDKQYFMFYERKGFNDEDSLHLNLSQGNLPDRISQKVFCILQKQVSEKRDSSEIGAKTTMNVSSHDGGYTLGIHLGR